MRVLGAKCKVPGHLSLNDLGDDAGGQTPE